MTVPELSDSDYRTWPELVPPEPRWIPVVNLRLTDVHPWWACQCRDCRRRQWINNKLTVRDGAAAAASFAEKLISADDVRALTIEMLRQALHPPLEELP